MRLFGGGQDPVDAAKVARDEASRQSIIAGGLPLNAIDRLNEQAQRARDGRPFFSSDLSVNELLLTHQCGFAPLGQVMGSCVYQQGWQFLPQSQWVYASQEMSVMTQAQVDARHLAFSRLQEEARLLGADGVVGVRFTRSASRFGFGEIEFMAIGTAVRRIDAPPLASGALPFVSNLSGQDHWLLRRAGCFPAGFVFGTCAWFQYPDWRTQNSMLSWSNAELTTLSQGLYTARELAMDRMEAEAARLSARGIVGVTFESHIEHLGEGGQSRVQAQGQNPGGFIMHCTVWGTAIGYDPGGPPPNEPTSTVLPIGP